MGNFAIMVWLLLATLIATNLSGPSSHDDEREVCSALQKAI
jgi:hypothetical protein